MRSIPLTERYTFENGDYLEPGEGWWVEYDDGTGPHITGGPLYDKNGKYIGHIDLPGPRGYSGYSGCTGISESTEKERILTAFLAKIEERLADNNTREETLKFLEEIAKED